MTLQIFTLEWWFPGYAAAQWMDHAYQRGEGEAWIGDAAALHAAGKTSDKGLIELSRSCSSVIEGATEKQ